jgi:hypothetical protein
VDFHNKTLSSFSLLLILFFQIICEKTKNTETLYYIIKYWEYDSDFSLKCFLLENILK